MSCTCNVRGASPYLVIIFARKPPFNVTYCPSQHGALIQFYHKLINNQTPKYFTSLSLVFNFENHEHNTRRINYITHSVRREYANLCVRNSLPYFIIKEVSIYPVTGCARRLKPLYTRQ